MTDMKGIIGSLRSSLGANKKVPRDFLDMPSLLMYEKATRRGSMQMGGKGKAEVDLVIPGKPAPKSNTLKINYKKDLSTYVHKDVDY